ncbi:hypothetical protein [Namhaeicola litoreus]|uniref:Tetratricopeptide repeat protein n=1 Tax=Namhaeicola litoreus TaxID=1052145 RepID=A0ABW3Y1Q7_9FLAO
MTKNDALFRLVKTLSKSEKRQFKLYAGRLGVNAEKNFMALFDVLDKLEEFDEQIILSKTKIKKQQLSNAKAHLYKQILISLRLNPSQQNVKVQIREQLDFATILFNKGLHRQSLKILEKAKANALQNFENNLAYEIVELEKVIESQYITRSLDSRADDLIQESMKLSKSSVLLSKLSNLSLQLYSYMLKKGYAKSKEDYATIKDFFESRIPEYNLKEMGFKEKLFLYKAFLWYSFITQDFLSCYKYSQKWVSLFDENPEMKKVNPVFYLKGVNYLLESLFIIQRIKKFRSVLISFKKEMDQELFTLNDNTSSLASLTYYQNRINLFFLEGEFTKGTEIIPEILKEISLYKKNFDEHHVMIFYYKIASMYFGAEKFDECIFYLNKIIRNKDLTMREDLLCFSRMLSLIAHYEAGYDQNLEEEIKSTFKFLLKMNELYGVQRKVISFLRSLSDIYPHELKSSFVKLYEELKAFENHPYEKRAFMYLDLISWLESKIQGKPVEEVIRQKALLKMK